MGEMNSKLIRDQRSADHRHIKRRVCLREPLKVAYRAFLPPCHIHQLTIGDDRDIARGSRCLDLPGDAVIGYFYRDFRQVGDQEVVAILERFPAKRAGFDPLNRADGCDPFLFDRHPTITILDVGPLDS